MKKLLKLFSIISLSTVPVMNVVACGNKTTTPTITAINLNGKYATLIDWYSDENTSKITQKLFYILGGYLLVFNTDIFTNINFKDKLLTLDSTTKKYKAINDTASDFLKELGFMPETNNLYYSESDVENINKLKASYSKDSGEWDISKDTNDFIVAKRNITIDIKLNNKITNRYIVFTKDHQSLDVPTEVSNIITSKTDLTLDASSGFQENKPITSFTLKFVNPWKKIQWNALVRLLNETISLNWYDASTGTTPLTGNFNNTANYYLEIKLGTVLVTTTRIDCGQAVTA